MIADLQAVKFNRKEIESSCWKIIKHVGNKKSISGPILNALIMWFSECNSYDIAAERAKMIMNEFEYNPRQIRQIRKHIKNNFQIHQTKEARETIFKFMDK